MHETVNRGRNDNEYNYAISLQTYIPTLTFKMWAEKWTIMQEASSSSTALNAARRISC